MRSVSQFAEVSINTVSKLLADAGKLCAALHDRDVRDVKSSRVQFHKIWSFAVAHDQHGTATETIFDESCNVWTWIATDSDTKLIIAWLVGGRDSDFARTLWDSVRRRLDNPVNLRVEGNQVRLKAGAETLGNDTENEMLAALYGLPDGERRSPAFASYERDFSQTGSIQRKLESYVHMVALYTVWYNFIRINPSLKKPPAMAAGISERLWSMADLPEMMDEFAKTSPRGARARRHKHFSQEI